METRGNNGQSGPNDQRWDKAKDKMGQVRQTTQHWSKLA